MKKKEACVECGKMMKPGVGMATHLRMMHGIGPGATPPEQANGHTDHPTVVIVTKRRRKTKTASTAPICFCPSCGYNLKGIAKAMQVE